MGLAGNTTLVKSTTGRGGGALDAAAYLGFDKIDGGNRDGTTQPSSVNTQRMLAMLFWPRSSRKKGNGKWVNPTQLGTPREVKAWTLVKYPPTHCGPNSGGSVHTASSPLGPPTAIKVPGG